MHRNLTLPEEHLRASGNALSASSWLRSEVVWAGLVRNARPVSSAVNPTSFPVSEVVATINRNTGQGSDSQDLEADPWSDMAAR
jgi:hypothetical protein